MPTRKKSRRKAKYSSPIEPSKCSVCQATGAETFQFMRGSYIFDVDLAREIVQDGREPMELEPDDVRYCVDTTSIRKHHIPHVDPRYPGIIAHLAVVTDSQETVTGQLLIDGNHRAARCLELGQPYQVYVLTEEESRQILVKTPGTECRCKHCLAEREVDHALTEVT